GPARRRGGELVSVRGGGGGGRAGGRGALVDHLVVGGADGLGGLGWGGREGVLLRGEFIVRGPGAPPRERRAGEGGRSGFESLDVFVDVGELFTRPFVG